MTSIDSFRNTRNAGYFLAGLSIAMMAGVFIFQYGFGYQPCELCLLQRIPWWVAMGIGSLTILLSRRTALAALLPIAGVATLVTGATIAAYHAGVEYKWWEGPTACTGSLPTDLDALKKAIMEAPIVRCDEVQWSLFGISMAGYNFIISTMGAIALAFIARGRCPFRKSS